MNFRSVALAAALLVTGVAQAAVTSFGGDSANDAGSTYGSTDTFGGLSGIGNLNLNLNGTTGNVFLESLNPNLTWGEITLLVRDLTTEGSFQSPTPTAVFGGLTGVLQSTTLIGSVLGVKTNEYAFTFAGNLSGNANYHLTLGGFRTTLGPVTVNDAGFAELSVTAVPEPETYSLMIAGLGAIGFLARRRRVG